MRIWPAWDSSDWRAKTCCVVMVRCWRPRPRNATVQLKSTAIRFLKPARAMRWTASHRIQARKPDRRTRPTLATALKREIVASVPLSLYTNGRSVVSPRSLWAIVLAA